MADFYAIPTTIGEAKLANALALGIPLQITQLAVGDGAGAGAQGTPLPNPAQTALVSERRRAPINTLATDPSNANVLIAEQIIPEDVGGWWIREMGLFDVDGTLIAVCNTPPTYKPVLASGSGRTQIVRMQIIVTDVAAVTLKIDPAVVLATRQYVDDKVSAELSKLDGKQSVRAATTAAIALNGLQTIDDIVLAAGDRVLVKDQAAAKDNGIYVVSAGAWARAADADASAEVTPGMSVAVEQGTANADNIFVLVTDGPITLGVTALAFDTVGRRGLAPLVSPAFTGNPTAPTQAAGDNSTKVSTTAFVQAAIAALVASSPAALDTLNELAAALGNDANFAATVTNALALKAPLASPTLTGNPTAPTPAQFDKDTTLATTDFVQRALGNWRDNSVAISVSGALTASQAGSYVHFGDPGSVTATLPSLADVPNGATFLFSVTSASGTKTVAAAGIDTIVGGNISTSSLSMGGGDSLLLMKASPGGAAARWQIVGGSVALRASQGDFGSSLGSNGYQKLPSGLIIQWGVVTLAAVSTPQVFTFPIAFPAACYVVFGSNADNVLSRTAAYGPTATGFSAISDSGANRYVVFIAVGK
jgi:phage-related tail fiber protein